ncbi:MAG: peptide ABC transporter substrate-binding protein [Defluviitaleaceae bacterium]|nr:peptide ABC transporter substrate-binding protein [Defluviitaleaceae bacterium]MCL2837184.1 peptide ABC transporter substrate-binding protein [Defluviitaleaceae bacterium]
MRKIFITLFIFLCFMFASCGNRDAANPALPDAAETPEPPPAATPERQRRPDFGGTLVLTMRSPRTLNPLLNADETVDKVLSLLFDKLFILDQNQKPTPNPALIQSYTVSADAKSLTLTMRNDIHWSDGTRVTAGDVAYSIDFLVGNAPADAIYKDNVANVQSTTVTGDSVRINLRQPDAYMGYTLTVPIVPQAYYRNASATSSRQMNPVGSGPYALESYMQGRELVLSASPSSLRQPYIETVEVRITDSIEQDLNAISNGIADAAYIFEPGWRKAAAAANARALEFVSPYFDFLGFNFDNPVLNNREVRAAIAHSLPYAQLPNSVYLGEARLSPTPISPGSWLHDETVSHAEFNLEKAARLLDEAEIYGLELRILVNAESPERKRIAEILAVNLRALSIDIELTAVPWDDYRGMLSRGEFDIFFGGYKLSPNPYPGFMLHSNGGQNHMRYRDPVMDTLLQNANAARDDGAMILAYQNLQNYIAGEMPVIGLVFRTVGLLVSSRVQGPLEGNGIYNNIEEWYIETR